MEKVSVPKYRKTVSPPKLKINSLEEGVSKTCQVTSVTQNINFLINCAQICFVCPGAIQYDTHSRRYELKYGIVRKATATSFLALFVVTLSYMTVVDSLDHEHGTATSKVVFVLKTASWAITNFCIIRAFFDQSLSKILNRIHSIECKLVDIDFYRPNRIWMNHLLRLLLPIPVLMYVFYVDVFVNYSLDESVPWNFETVIALLSLRGNVLLNPVTLNCSTLENFKGSTDWILVFRGIVMESVFLHAASTEIFGHMLVISISVASSFLIYTFFKGLKTTRFISDIKLKELVEDFLELFICIEDVLGWIVFFLGFANLPFFASFLQQAFRQSKVAQVIFLFYTILFLMMSVPAAYCNTMINSLPVWLRRRSRSCETLANNLWICESCGGSKSAEAGNSCRGFEFILQEIGTREVGIRGKVFTITFSFIAQVGGLAVSYAVLLHQFQ